MYNYGRNKWEIIKSNIVNFINKNKWLLIILGIVFIVALLTGVFTAIKLYNLDNDIELDNYSMFAFVEGELYSFKYFIFRFLSCVIVSALLFVCSLNKFLYIFGFILLIYRAFLITLNCTFIIIKQGLSGFISSLIIILPCQIIMLCILLLIFLKLIEVIKNKKECGYISNENKISIITYFILLLIVDIIEILLLSIFKPTTILVI